MSNADIIMQYCKKADMPNSTNLNMHLSKIYLTKLIEKIKSCDFDKRVAMGDASIIAELAKNEINLFSLFGTMIIPF